MIREPCSPNPFHNDYLRDLRRGIDEQQWSLNEYASIFSEAGFEVVRGMIRSQCSLNAVLQPAYYPSKHVREKLSGE